jgi:hypothetical protein
MKFNDCLQYISSQNKLTYFFYDIDEEDYSVQIEVKSMDCYQFGEPNIKSLYNLMYGGLHEQI